MANCTGLMSFSASFLRWHSQYSLFQKQERLFSVCILSYLPFNKRSCWKGDKILSGETVGTGDNLYSSAQVPTSMLSSHLLGFIWLYGNYFVHCWFQPFIKSIFLTQKRIWNKFVQWTINCTLRNFSQRDENLFLCWNLYTKVCSSFICNNSKQEITQMSFNAWVAEQILVHLRQSTLLINQIR